MKGRLNNGFYYQQKIENGEIQFSLTPCEEAELQYAFYLKRNNAVIVRGWYSEKSVFSCPLGESGCYQVVVFTKESNHMSDAPVISEAEPMRYEKKLEGIRLSIFGSCVSRDMLEFFPKGQIKLQNYIARQSVISAVSETVPIRDEEISLESKFQRDMVLCDIKKTAFERLKSETADYLILDLIDERFSLVNFDNSYLTYSNEFKKGFQNSAYSDRIRNKEFQNESVLLEGRSVLPFIQRFCEQITAIYRPDQIILHRALMVNSYHENGAIHDFSANYLRSNEKTNTILNWMYDQIETMIPDLHVINEISGTVADASHKWGLAPMHYEESYYQRVVNRICELVSLTK